MTKRVGIHHKLPLECSSGSWPACDVIRIEVPEVPVLGQIRMEIDKLPTDLAALNKYVNRALAEAMAFGYDYGIMAARADPNAPFIDAANERILEACHSNDPEEHKARVERSTARWQDEDHSNIEWVEKTGRLGA